MADLSAQAPRPRDAWVGWSAVATSALAVFAWASCCVLPMGLSLAGLSLAGSGLFAGQRTWITFAALGVVGAGWALVVRRARRCRAGGACAPPSRVTVGLLAAATLLTAASLIWAPVVEPAALHGLMGLRR